ncbi:unnamed protein product [Closterium sp. NIES-54]
MWPQHNKLQSLSIPYVDFHKSLSRCENGVGAGPSGTTFEHLRDSAITNASVCTHLHALVNTMIRGKLPQPLADLLTSSRLIALAKPDSGARPIAIGECLTRLAAKAALSVVGEAAQEFFLPLQFGVAFPSGAEAIIHTIRAFTDAQPDTLILQTDLSNAFNSILRQAIVTALQDDALQPLLPLVQLIYGNPLLLYLDASFNNAPLASERGVRQGDPLGPLLYRAGIHPALHATAAAYPRVLCLAYADDVMFLGAAAETTEAFAHFTRQLELVGLQHNPGKCAAWSRTRLDRYVHLPPGVPLSGDGVRQLGSFIDTTDGTASFITGQLTAMAKPLPLLERMDPQTSSLLLMRCISCRVAYLTWTTPLNLLPDSSWS